jgi:hypothetical protein
MQSSAAVKAAHDFLDMMPPSISRSTVQVTCFGRGYIGLASVFCKSARVNRGLNGSREGVGAVQRNLLSKRLTRC